MSNTSRIAHNTIVQVIGRGITAVLSVIILSTLGRYLGVEGYGQFNLIFAYLGLFGVVVDFGFFLLQVREISKKPDQEAHILGNVYGLKLALSVITFAAAYFIGLFVYDDPVLTQGILLGIVSQASISFMHLSTSHFQAHLQMYKVAIVGVLARAAYVGAMFWGIQQDVGILGIIGLISLVNLLGFIVQHLMAEMTVKIRPRFNFDYWKMFIMEALPVGAVTVLSMLYFRIDTIMLGAFQDNYALGVYTAPYKIIEVILTVPVMFMSSVFPILTQALTQGNEHVQRIFSKAFDASWIVGVPIAAGMYAVATPIMTIIMGPEFAASGAVLQILIWVTALSFVGAVLNYTVIAAGRQSVLVIPYIVATLFNVLVNLYIIPRYSYIGASFVTVATELLVVLWVGYIVKTNLGLVPRGWVWIKAILGGAALITVISLVGSSNLILNIMMGAATYGIFMLLTGGITKSQVLRILPKR